MKLRPLLCIAWLATTCWAVAQRPRPGEPTSLESTYGASPSTSPQMFQKPPAPAAATGTANLTNNNTTQTGPDASLSGNTPAAAANTTTNPAIADNMTVPSGLNPPAAMPAGPDYSSSPMPISMDTIDNEHQLIPGDQIIVEIVEDREPFKKLFVDEKGMIIVPWLNKPIFVEGQTLRDAAELMKAALQGKNDDAKSASPSKSLGFYQDGHPTVLATYFSKDHSRGQATVDGDVQKPDKISIPQDGVLTLTDAIRLAGGFSSGADREHVLILHHDPKNSSNDTRETVNMSDLGSKDADKLVLPGDSISVSSARLTGPTYTISGHGVGHGGGHIPLQPGMTVSEAVQLAGTTQFSKLYAVRLRHYDKDPQTGQPIIDPKSGKQKIEEKLVDVDDILQTGNKNADPVLQDGDWIIVEEKWISSPF